MQGAQFASEIIRLEIFLISRAIKDGAYSVYQFTKYIDPKICRDKWKNSEQFALEIMSVTFTSCAMRIDIR